MMGQIDNVDIVILFEVRNRTDSLRVGRHIWIWKCWIWVTMWLCFGTALPQPHSIYESLCNMNTGTGFFLLFIFLGELNLGTGRKDTHTQTQSCSTFFFFFFNACGRDQAKCYLYPFKMPLCYFLHIQSHCSVLWIAFSDFLRKGL